MKLNTILWILLVTFFMCNISSVAAEEYKVGILMWKTAVTYDEAVEGLEKGFEEMNLNLDKELINVEGNKEKAVEVLKKFESDQKDLIIAFGSFGTKLAFENVKEIPVVVLGGNTPVAYGVTDDPKRPGGNLTGSSYFIEPEKQIKYFMKIYPEMKSLGILYNPDNGASIAEIPLTKQFCQEVGIELVEQKVVRPLVDGKLEEYDVYVKRLPLATEELIAREVDAILIPTNSEIYGYLENVLQVTIPNKIPVFSFPKKGVHLGALAGLTSDNRKLGYHTAEIIMKILVDKVDPGEISFIFDDRPHRLINLKAAKEIDFEVPIAAIQAASKIIK